MCEVDTDGQCEVWNEEERRTRKERKCSCCGLTIAIGDRYLNTFAVFEGEATTHHDCMRCKAAGDAFAELHGVTFRGVSLADYLNECLGDEPESRVWISAFFQVDVTMAADVEDDIDIRFDLPRPAVPTVVVKTQEDEK